MNRTGYHKNKIILPASMYYKLPSTCGRYSVQALICSVASLVPWCVYGNKGGNLNFAHVNSAHLCSVFCVRKGRHICLMSFLSNCRSFQFFFAYIPDTWKLFLNLSVRLSSPRNVPYLSSALNNTRQQNFTFFFWHTRENIKS